MSEPTRGLTAEQLEMLLRPLNGNRVQQHKGQAHLEAWDVRKWLTRVFGFGGWSDTILDLALVHESVWPWTDNKGEPVPGKNRATVVYRVTLRLTVKDVHGNVIGSWDDVATGEAVNQASVGDAHDLAVKAATSQALKRCAVNLGDQFGLSLYNKGSLGPVVIKTLGHPCAVPADATVPDDAPVVGGELDEQVPAEKAEEAENAPRPAAQMSAPVAEKVRNKGPEAAPEQQRMISDGQCKAIHTLLSVKRGRLTDEQKHAGFGKFTGREVTSTRQLTYVEAANLLDALSKLPDFRPEQPAEQAGDGDENFHQAEALLRLEQDQAAQQLEEDVRDAIESAGNYGELTAAMSMATAARDDGRLTREQFEKLATAADQRAASGNRTAVAA